MDGVSLGRLQFRIMHVLWDKTRAHARDITETLNCSEPVAHSTVQTLLRQLEAKGAIGHDVEDRTFVFFPKLIEEQVKQSATHELVERVFGGDVRSLVAHLLRHEKLSQTELNELRRLIEHHRESRAKE
jgi:BlaI family penicillinase repressor